MLTIFHCRNCTRSYFMWFVE